MISVPLLQSLEAELSALEGSEVKVERVVPIQGGSVNQTYGLHTAQKKYFVKVNSSSLFPRMFEKEANALEQLRSLSKLRIPKPLLKGAIENEAYLLMEFIESASPKVDFWEEFGRGLAVMHQITTTKGFGLEEDNYVGSLVQQNDWKTDWADFFIENRLQFQEKMAKDAGLIDSSLLKSLEKLYGKLKGLFPEENASFLHGDLWSGNFMVGDKGEAVVMDPAIYYGSREMDIAMTYLFGGFNAKFYKAYQEEFPLEKNWEERIEICNLYPIFVHVNLFGGSYANRLKTIVSRFV